MIGEDIKEMESQIRERKWGMIIQNFTDLLGPDLILYGFTLYGDAMTGILLYDSEAIKCWQSGKYSLKAIKRYCRLYLLKKV